MTQLNASRGGFARSIRFVGMGISHPMYSVTSASVTVPTVDGIVVAVGYFEPMAARGYAQPLVGQAYYRPLVARGRP